MAPSPADPGVSIFDGLYARGAAAAAVEGSAWLEALLEVEAALAQAQADAGAIGREAADAVEAACRPDLYDPAALAARGADFANPVPALVEALRERAGGAAAAVHIGATSQDILDSAAMLIAMRAVAAIRLDLAGAADSAADLAREHRDTPMLARTLMQPAVPTTFGLRAAGWMAALDGARQRLGELRFPAQLGGAGGTRAAFGEAGAAVASAFAQRLGLAEAPLPWHADRGPVAELAGALGRAAGTVAKPALDVVLLSQAEVGELRPADRGRGGSSAMAHKHNPVAAISARACAAQTPGLVATLLAAMPGEHERAAGAWQSEWRALSELIRATGSAAAWLRDCLGDLEVDAERMRANLARAGEAAEALRADPGTYVPVAGGLVDAALAGRDSAPRE